MAVISGDGRDNLLEGGATADQIFGYGGNDTLFGRVGADSLYGGAGDDLLDGGPGRDLMNGGSGDDTVTYAANTSGITADLVTGVVEFRNQIQGPERLISIEGIIGGSGNDSLSGNAARNVIHGGDGRDWIDGRVGADALFGDGGNDAISGGSGSDTIDGGAGSDVLYGNDSDDVYPSTWYDGVTNALLIGLHKPDTVSYASETAALTFTLGALFEAAEMSLAGSSDHDTVYGFENVVGGSGADSITGNDEDNRLEGGRGNDTLVGGEGNDTLVGNAGTDRMDGGAGSDWVDYSENTSPLRLSLASQSVSFPGKPWAPESFASIENALTGSGNDTLIGNGGANVLDGGLGSDRINGRAGSDTVSYQSHTAAVSVNLALGSATIIGTSVPDTLISIENAIGGAGNDVLRGTASGNVLDGGAGNDTVTGGAGNDEIHLTAGSDVIDGGAGSDTVVLDFGYDAFPDLTATEIWNPYDYPEGYIIAYDGDSDADLVADLGAGTITTYGGLSVQGTLTGIENITTGVGNDVVIGSDAANVISVGHGANVVNAGGGNDLVIGSNPQTEFPEWFHDPTRQKFTDHRDAGEILRGGAGDDTLVGGMSMAGQGGNDRLVAALVAEETNLSGGTGADTFVLSDKFQEVGYHAYDVQAQLVRISDFNHDQGDRIVIEGDFDQDPVFVGNVTDKQEVAIGEWAILEESDTRYVYIALAREDDYGGVYMIDGVNIDIGTADFSEGDVLFV